MTTAQAGGPRNIVSLSAERLGDSDAAGICSAGWTVYPTSNPRGAQQLIERHGIKVGLVALDNNCADERRQALEGLLRRAGHIHWIGLIRPANFELGAVRRLIAEYFYDYHVLPIHQNRLLSTIGQAHGMATLSRAAETADSVAWGDNEIIGNSDAIQRVKRTIRKFAAVDAHVTITGESGTGKELVAQAVHARSSRADRPFVAINCGALPPSLIQTELFGYEKGAFSGAQKSKVGRIEAADGGIIMLDEIGELPLDLQVNLLRFLQERTIERVGGSEARRVNVRVIAATNVELEKAVAEGRCREELYYRINVLRLHLPPLRERKEDIAALAHHFLSRAMREFDTCAKEFSRRAINALHVHNWPGNIRELLNRVLRAAVMAEKRLIFPADLGLDDMRRSSERVTLQQARSQAEKEAIKHVLELTSHNVTETARLLAISRTTLYRLGNKYELLS